MKTIISIHRLASLTGALFLTLILKTSTASADVFTIDPNQSSLTLSGSVIGASLQQQAAGSLSTKFGGTIQLSQTANSVTFTGSSSVVAQTNGAWYPGANGAMPVLAAADYGAVASTIVGTAYAALRSVQFDLTSASIPVTNGQFNPNGVTFQFVPAANSVLDYYSAAKAGTLTLSGNATNSVAATATLATVGSTQTLTLQVNATFYFKLLSTGDTVVTVTGTIVATNSTGGGGSAVVIQTPSVSNHVVTLKWQSTSGQNFSVLSTTNFQSWQTNASGVTSGTSNYTYSATNQASDAFYRIFH